MRGATIATLAKASGVSLSTVNRLLHGTGTVRPETADRIVEVAHKIGFYGLGALHGRKRDNLPHRNLGFLMQQSHRALYQMWAEHISVAAASRTDAVVTALVKFEDDLAAEAVAENLLALGQKVEAVAVVTADHPLVSQAIDELKQQGVPVVAYVTDLSAASRAGFVGTDNWKAGRTAAWFLSQMAHDSGTIVPLIGNHRYQCQDISDASFRSYMREHAPEFHVSETLLTQEEPAKAYEVMSTLMAAEAELRGVFVNGGGISGVLRALRELDPGRERRLRVVCRDIGPETRKGLGEGLVTAALRHPLETTPQQLVDVMLRLLEGRATSSVEQRIVPFEIVTPESLWT